MNISLTSEQQAWINVRVERGDYASVEEAARQLIDGRIFELDIEDDDMAWAKPLVDEALAEVERGGFITLEEHHARMNARLASMKD